MLGGRIGLGMTNTLLLDQDPVLAEIVRRLVQEFSPARIFLFGSRARGDAGPDSDYDVMVVVTGPSGPRYKLAQSAQRVLWGISIGADVLFLSLSEFDEGSTVKCSLPATVLREGKELYAA